ncbi:MAG: TlpA family protein disulfide reductase [Candidatus Eremiobacteraeota bacterium]|nr:TlpA family protein disulfide reductase [Candidatus Eremiobacteraeota bacterium]
MGRNARTICYLLVGAVAAILPGCARHPSSIAESGSAELAIAGRPAPLWEAPTTSGGTLTLLSLRGKAVYLNFFASWCPPCNEEAPDINALQKHYASRGLRVVGVDIMENAGKAASFAAMHHLVYPVIVDGGILRRQYRVNGLPVHVFIDRNGTVRRIQVGEPSKAEMESAIKSIL